MKLTIIPHSTGRVRQIRVNNFLLFLVGLAVAVVFIDRYSRAKSVSDPEELAKNNKYLEKELKNYKSEYENLANKSHRLLSLVTERLSVNKSITHTGRTEDIANKTIDELLDELHKSKFILDSISVKLYQTPEIAKFTPSISPVEEGFIIQTFGKTKYIFTGEERECQGVDFSAPLGSKVRATADGIVKFAGTRPHSGLTVEIEHKPTLTSRMAGSNGNGFITKYSHLSLSKVSKGQSVKRGEIIGFVGTTGKTIGPMLHYEVWLNDEPRDPLDFILTEVHYY